MADLEKFRTETRNWLEGNCPQSMRTPMPEAETCWGGRRAVYPNPDSKIWLERMGLHGWTAPLWPKKYGGGGLTKEENKILQEELRRLRARPALYSFGIWMLGPALLEYGSEAQKQEFLPQIVRGEIRWCQGYSEPGAGSDLAGLQTFAEDKGDHYVVNGQKIWTSYANYADWIFCLVRTDRSKKHEGISFLLFDMQSPGVTTRPIKLISGSSPFCETFFDNVKVPKGNLVGTPGGGWTIAKALLHHERTMISEMGLGGPLGGGTTEGIAQIAKRYIGEKDGRIVDPVMRDHISAHEIRGRAFSTTVRRAEAEARTGANPGAFASMFKYYGTEHNKNRFELLVEILGNQAFGWEGEGYSARELDITRQWLRSKGNSIEGGTSEVQLNVVSKRVLGLPEVR